MSKWYPCIYCTEDLRCEKYSGDGVISHCVLGPCSDEKPSNADRIRAMSDEEMAVVIAWPYLASPPWCSEHTTCPYISEDPTPCDKCALDWLKQEVSE